MNSWTLLHDIEPLGDQQGYPDSFRDPGYGHEEVNRIDGEASLWAQLEEVVTESGHTKPHMRE